MQLMHEQMTTMMRLIETREEDRRGRDRESAIIPPDRETAKPAKLTASDDIEAYLYTFERMMEAYRVDETLWVYRLAPQLTGKAQQAYVVLPRERAGDYDELKAAILRHYNLDEEAYRQRFRTTTKNSEESYRELAIRLKDLMAKWSRDAKRRRR